MSHDPAEIHAAPSSRDLAIFRATGDDVARMYAKIERDDSSPEGHYLWRGAKRTRTRGQISVSGQLVGPHRLALYAATGVLYERATQACGEPWCIRPSHWAWDRTTRRITREATAQAPAGPTPEQLAADGLLRPRFLST